MAHAGLKRIGGGDVLARVSLEVDDKQLILHQRAVSASEDCNSHRVVHRGPGKGCQVRHECNADRLPLVGHRVISFAHFLAHHWSVSLVCILTFYATDSIDEDSDG